MKSFGISLVLLMAGSASAFAGNDIICNNLMQNGYGYEFSTLNWSGAVSKTSDSVTKKLADIRCDEVDLLHAINPRSQPIRICHSTDGSQARFTIQVMARRSVFLDVWAELYEGDSVGFTPLAILECKFLK